MKNFLLILLFFTFSTISFAQTTVTWDGGGTTDNWNDAANWDTNTIPTINDNVVIDNTFVAGDIFVEVNANAEANAVTLQSSGGTRDGSTIFLDVYDVLTVSGNIAIINDGAAAVLSLAGTGTLNVGGSISGSGTLDPDPDWNIANNTTVIYNGSGSQDIYLTQDYINLTINNTGTATLAGDAGLTGNFTNNGNFSHTSGTITFAGAGGTIAGTATTDFLNVAFNGSTNNNGNVEIKSTGQVSIGNSVTLDVDGDGSGNFRLLSTSETNTAKILAIPSGSSVTGNLIVERYMQDITASHGTEDWRYISSPLKSTSVADLQSAKTQEFFITGTFAGASTCTGCNSENPSMHFYDEPTTGVLSDGWWTYDFPEVTNEETLEVGRGYIVWQRDANSPVTLEITGTPNQGSINLPVTFTNGGTGDPLLHDGWNLVGNPYPAPIDWSNQAAWSFTDLNGTVYVRDNDGIYGTKGDFIEHNGSVGSPQIYEGRIAMGQAFWVKSDGGNPSLTVTENAKTPESTIFLRKAAPDNVLRVKMVKNADVWDEAVLHFRDDAVVEYESDIDALKREGYNVNFSTISSDNVRLVINSLPTAMCSEIPVYINPENTKGTYDLSFSGEETFTYEFKATLVDSYLDKSVDVAENTSYTFNITDDEASYGAERFTLIVSKGINTELEMNAAAVCSGEDASIFLNNPQNGTSYKAVVNGEVVSEALSEGKELDLTIPAEHLNPTAEVVIKASTECHGEVEIPQAVKLTINETPDPEITRIDEYTLQSNYATGNQWYFNNEEIPGATEQELEIESTGTYSLKVVNENSCEARVDAELTVTAVDEKLAELGVEIYPNPVDDIITINTGSMKNPHLHVTSVSGKVNYTQHLKTGLNEVELSSLEKGLYLIKIRDRNDQVVLRIIKK